MWDSCFDILAPECSESSSNFHKAQIFPDYFQIDCEIYYIHEPKMCISFTKSPIVLKRLCIHSFWKHVDQDFLYKRLLGLAWVRNVRFCTFLFQGNSLPLIVCLVAVKILYVYQLCLDFIWPWLHNDGTVTKREASVILRISCFGLAKIDFEFVSRSFRWPLFSRLTSEEKSHESCFQ